MTTSKLVFRTFVGALLTNYVLLITKNNYTYKYERVSCKIVPLAGIARHRGRRVLAQGVVLVREGGIGTGTKVSVKAGGGGREGRIRRGEGLGAERSILSSPPAGRAANLKGKRSLDQSD